MKQFLLIWIVTIFIILSGCKTGNDSYFHCPTKYIRLSRDTTVYKRLVWTKCYYPDKRIKLKAFNYFTGGGSSFEKVKEYYENGNFKVKEVYKRKKNVTEEFYTNGKLKSRTIVYAEKFLEKEPFRDLYQSRTRTLLVDSITRHKSITIKLDTTVRDNTE